MFKKNIRLSALEIEVKELRAKINCMAGDHQWALGNKYGANPHIRCSVCGKKPTDA